MKSKMNLALTTLALAASVSTASAQTLVWSDDFNDNNPIGWDEGQNGEMNEINQQFRVSGNLPAFQPANPLATHLATYHSIPTSGPLPDNQTLELRADLVAANPNDGFAGLHFLWAPQAHGYAFFKDEDEVGLLKFWNDATTFAWFFYETNLLKNQNVTLVLALTRLGSSVKIRTQVWDKDRANAVLFDRTVTDTPQVDPVLPDGSVRGSRSTADLAGTPWPVTAAPAYVELTLQWIGPQAAFAQVTFDNLELWQYESPQLTIQNAVVLSWPVTAGLFVVESASAVNGPWETVPAPWTRTNATEIQVSVPTSASAKFFRLRFGP
ncbi:MAG: hypothetical protein FJ387_24090 [Verrucomicrobia bacterium]|nr:hypothetical protein [Verrucomicrobiota bacterium]